MTSRREHRLSHQSVRHEALRAVATSTAPRAVAGTEEIGTAAGRGPTTD